MKLLNKRIVPEQQMPAEKAPLDGRFRFATKTEADQEAYDGAIFYIVESQLWFRYKIKNNLLVAIPDDALNALDYALSKHQHDLSDVKLLAEAIGNTYTKSEVQNMVAAVVTQLDWKPAVDTFTDIATTYPSPKDGWTVSVRDQDIIYRYNGTEWVDISSRIIPLATALLDGLMSKSDKAKLDRIEDGATKISQEQIQAWNAKLDPVPGKVLSSHDFETKYKNKLDELLYTAFVLSFTSTPAAGNYEKGQKLNVSLSFNASRALTALSVKRGSTVLESNPEAIAFTDPTEVTANTTYTITANDGAGFAQSEQTKSLSFTFLSRRYWGVSAKASLTSDEIRALSSELSTTRAQSRTFDCTGGRYFFFAWPSLFGTPTFVIGGLTNTDFTKETVQVTNAFGLIEAYDVYHINNLQNGNAIPVTVQ